MFPDSNIAKNVAWGKTKSQCHNVSYNVSYNVTYGLAPYFKSLLNDALLSSDCFVAILMNLTTKV